MAEAVRVAVRVRPFNSREESRKAELIIKMHGNTTEIKDPKNAKAEPKKFAFDYSYWSHDQYKERSDGYLEPQGSVYADQMQVFNDLGRGVLDNAWKGYNCSLFAYGQTGSGKSYSMVGYGTNKGIVPISCEELFKEIEVKRTSAGKGEEYQVTFSMLEIYNEQVQDLLNTAKVKGGLKIRQKPNAGFYVENLQQAAVNNYKDIEKKMDLGTKNRTVASTNMNATSSRAHTIVGIQFSQKKVNDAGKSMTKTSVINLVDLAGSERAESTGATGDRLKEGANINKSLSTLGNCIKALADQSQGKKGTMVPFRDSVLTKLLMNALGGNSKTVMIAALSPADINYDETLSTLRFADRAKAVKTTAVVNESPTDKLIRELREENEKLKKLLESGGVAATGDGGGDSEQWKEQLEANKREMQELEQSFEERYRQRELELKAELEADKKEKEQVKNCPHLSNLNEDPALTGKIIHILKGIVKIGGAKDGKGVDIPLVGLGIVPKHADISEKKGVIYLEPGKGRCLLNGTAVTAKKELKNRDRIMFGNTNLFLYINPKDEKHDSPLPTFEDAQTEIAKNSGLNQLAGNGKSQEDLLLMEDLVQIWPMIGNANSMSEEMDKKVKFEIVLVSPQARGEKHGRTQVCVKMRNLATKNEFLWEREMFLDRYFLMQEMYQNFVEGDNIKCDKEQDDPFWEDPSSEILIGCVHVYLQSLSYMIDTREKLQITDYKGQNQGHINIEVFPCSKDGSEICDDFVDEPDQLIGRELNAAIKIAKAQGIPKRFKQSFCRYKFYLEDKPCQSAEATGANPSYDHQRQLNFKPVTKQLLDYLQQEPLVIEVWGRQEPRQDDGTLNTKELMIKNNNKIGKQPSFKEKADQTEQQYRSSAETAMYKRRTERAEAKIKKAMHLLQTAKTNGQTSVSLDELEKAISSGSRLKAVANIIMQSERIKNGDSQNSQACVIQ